MGQPGMAGEKQLLNREQETGRGLTFSLMEENDNKACFHSNSCVRRAKATEKKDDHLYCLLDDPKKRASSWFARTSYWALSHVHQLPLCTFNAGTPEQH